MALRIVGLFVIFGVLEVLVLSAAGGVEPLEVLREAARLSVEVLR